VRWRQQLNADEGLKQVVADPRHHGERREEHRERETDGITLEQQHDRIRDLLRDLPLVIASSNASSVAVNVGTSSGLSTSRQAWSAPDGKHRNAIEPTYAFTLPASQFLVAMTCAPHGAAPPLVGVLLCIVPNCPTLCTLMRPAVRRKIHSTLFARQKPGWRSRPRPCRRPRRPGLQWNGAAGVGWVRR
jgi:hypothetical protein